MLIFIFSLISLLCAVALLFTGVQAYALNRHNPINIIFLFYCLTAGLLAFFEFMARQAVDPSRGYLWINMQQIAPLTAIAALHFILEYMEKFRRGAMKFLHILLYLPFAVYLYFLVFSGVFRVKAIMTPWGFAHGGYETSGYMHLIPVLWMVLLSFSSIIMSFLHYRGQKQGSAKAAAFYVFIAMSFPFIGATLENTLFKGPGTIPELITLATLISAAFLAIAIHRHSLFEINPEMAAENIIRTVDSYILLVDNNGIIKSANPAFYDTLGAENGSLYGSDVRSIFMNGFEPVSFGGNDTQIKITEPIKNLETCLKTVNGAPIYVLLSVSPLSDSIGVRQGYVLAAANINQRITLENNLLAEITRADMANADLEKTNLKLLELDRMKKNFIAIVSHELRTPLTSIKGFLSFLAHGVGGNLSERQLEFTGSMTVNVEKLLKLINELLDFSKIDSGTFSVDKKDADLSITARKAIIEMEPIAAKKNIKIVDLIKTASLPAVFDDTRIGQVVINLLNNAVKYTYSGTNIYLALGEISDPRVILPDYLKNESGPAGRYYLLSVRDKGPGMDPKYCRKIFDQFYQIEDANTRKHEGVGLGLNISMNIIKAHSGQIWAGSEGEGKGAVFSFLLPVA